jgi:hypothetical protein
LIGYLLHTLPDSEREELEERWFEDSALYEQLQAAEAELLDQYARGELSGDVRNRVETYLLGSPRQREKLIFSQALQKSLAVPRGSRMSWQWIAATAAIVILGVATFTLTWRIGAMRRILAETVRTRPLSPSSIYVAEVPAGTNRGAGSSAVQVNLPAGTEVVRLDLELAPGDETQVFAASVTQAGRQIWTEDPLHAERRSFGFAAPVWIPGANLPDGEFEIKLSAAGKPVDYYSFRVHRAP